MTEVSVKPGQIVRHDIEIPDYPTIDHGGDGILLLFVSLGVLIVMFLWRK